MSTGNKDKDGFTQFSGDMFGKTLAQKLVPVADRLRDINTQLGTRAYLVRIVRLQWSGGRRGVGREFVVSDIPITPTPLVRDLSPLLEELTPVGLNETGTLQVTEISGRFTEEILLGIDPTGNEPDDNEQVLYEIEFPRPNGQDSVRRRFGISAAPTFQPTQFQWTLQITKVDEDRTFLGDPQ
jgi:hypothetical protein